MTAKHSVVKRLLRYIVLLRGLPVDHVKNYLPVFFLILFYFIYHLFLSSDLSCLFFLLLFFLFIGLLKI